jgi:hypothetical protein
MKQDASNAMLANAMRQSANKLLFFIFSLLFWTKSKISLKVCKLVSQAFYGFQPTKKAAAVGLWQSF